MKAIKHIRGRREMEKEQARQAIISSTKKCFSQKGVSKTSTLLTSAGSICFSCGEEPSHDFAQL